MHVTFHGAVDTVTGSRFLVESRGQRVLVDCGLFQGVKAVRVRNREPFAVDPRSLDAVVLTHAHIDHSGYLPALIQQGFRGRVLASAPTAALCAILLPDSGYLQEEEARFRNKYGRTKHHPAMPLYTAEDGETAARRIEAVPTGDDVDLGHGLTLRMTPAGHILGARSVWIGDGKHSIVFSGDVGRSEDPIMYPPRPMPEADLVVVESTYGDRHHEEGDPKDALAAIARTTLERDGVLLIPAFAVGRAQSLLYLLTSLRSEGAIPQVPIYLNSPMAIDVTELFLQHADEHRLDAAACRRLSEGVTMTRTVDESKALNTKKGPMIIVSASGMATGGRIVHHLEAFGGDPRTTVLFAGYQAAGTRGHALVHGAEQIKLHGRYKEIRAEVRQLHGLSAHADQDELLSHLEGMAEPPGGAWVVHGEPIAQDTFRQLVIERLGWRAKVPHLGQTIDVATGRPVDHVHPG